MTQILEHKSPVQPSGNAAAAGEHKRNNLDLLRLVFASIVLLSHAPEIIDGTHQREPLLALGGALSLGDFAVNGFFILSGYLIVKSWTRQPSLLPFLTNRVLRIYPGFLVAFGISVLLIGPIATQASHYFAHMSPVKFVSTALLLEAPEWARSFDGQPYSDVNRSL